MGLFLLLSLLPLHDLLGPIHLANDARERVSRLEPGDEIILSIMEHHANIVPWHFLRERQGVVLKWVDVDVNGDLDPQAVIEAIGMELMGIELIGVL